MLKYKLLLIAATLPISLQAFAECKIGNDFTSGYSMPNMTASTTNINKYEGAPVSSAIFSREVSSASFNIFNVYVGCPVGVSRTIYGSLFPASFTPYSNNIFRFTNSSYAALGIKVEMGDAPAAAALKPLGLTDLPIYSYSGDSHGVKVKVTLYILPRPAGMAAYPPQIKFANLLVGFISLKRNSDGTLIPAGTLIPIYLTATVNIQESTCTLSPTDYTINLPDISVRTLGALNGETTLSGNNTATISINCANLRDGAGREVKAYITDALNPTSAGSILINQTGAKYAKGVGIRLRDQNNNIIRFDPSQAKKINKWTFANMGTSPIIQHTIKANYIRIASSVTPGLVFSQAYLNIVYD